ncbi:MAG: HD domain-containing protein [Treponema sp.]|nr:HD domain-containing protein [Treponema sp.]
MFSLDKIVISIPLVLSSLCILLMMGRKPSTEQKYALVISFLNMFFSFGYFLCFDSNFTPISLLGLKIVYASAIASLPVFIQIDSLLFNIRISRRLFFVITSFTVIVFFLLILTYDSAKFSNILSGSTLTLYYLYTISLSVFTFAIFIFRMITCPKNERLFFIRMFCICILPVSSLCFIHVNKIFFILPSYALSVFIIYVTVLVLRYKFSNLPDQALAVVENAVPGPCFILDDKLMVHDANLLAVQMFPEYLEVRKMLKKPVKANDLLLQIVFNTENDIDSENNSFEVEGKQYQGYCVAIKSEYRFYGYTVVLKDITAQSDVVLRLEKRNAQQKQILRYYENEISSIQSKIVSGLMQLIYSSDQDTGGHIRRVSNYTNVIARQLLADGKYSNKLTERYVEMLTKVSPLHDIGKIKIDKGLVTVPDTFSILNDVDVQRHVLSGAEVIDSLFVNNPEDLFYLLSKEITLYHHEWWDGEGYPKGLTGYEIPLSARIVAVADVFDNVSFRHYKETHKSNFNETFNAVVMYSGKRFDPSVIESFKNARTKIEKLYEEMVVEDFSLIFAEKK